MAINLDHSIYGRQFAAFADFAKANAGSPDTLVCMGGNEDPTQVWDKVTNPRKIVAKTDGDYIRSKTHFFLRFGDKAANYDLMFRIEDAGYDGYNACGNVKYSEQFKFDLSGDELKMTSHLTSQHIEP